MEDECLTLQITDVARGGSGVARDESGRVIFVPFTAPGDRVNVRIVQTKKHYAQGELVEVLEASSDRQEPRCPAFALCGGCKWQHLPYEFQWKIKTNGVRHALQRMKVEFPEPWDEMPAEQIWEYRNRIQLRGFKDEIGFFAPGTRRLVPVERCDIARPEINSVWNGTREEGKKFSQPYKVELEVLPTGAVRKVWNSAHGAEGFRQVHDNQNEKLKSWVASAITPGRFLMDLYGGSGNLSLGLAAWMTEIHCVDVSAPASPPAGTPKNLSFHRSPMLPWLRRWVKQAKGKPARSWSAIIDPPREGLQADFSETITHLEGLGAEEIVTVNCDPDAFARDVSRFKNRGWDLRRIGVLDFFPQTPHIESVALLVRNS